VHSSRPSKRTMNRTDRPGLYIHVPFCKSKCPYCDFYSITRTDRIEEWLTAVLAEGSFYRQEFAAFDSLYLGGGTPSLLGPRQVEKLIAGLQDLFRFDDRSEITIELNPDDVTRAGLAFYRSLGINRVSLGVQSLVEEEVRFLGRRHTSRQALSAVGEVAGAGFDEYSIDLIYGLPEQSVKGWHSTLKEALSFSPGHLSCYQLTVEGDNLFCRLKREGKLTLPDEPLQADLFVSTSEYLTGAGYLHYEISNFARGLENVSRHNVKYWQHVPYLGLGPAAHSFAGNKRWWNVRDIDRYLKHIKDGRTPVDGFEELSSSQMNLEKFLFGFRTMWGIDVRQIVPVPSQDKIRELYGSGFVTYKDDRITPTLKGYLFADKLPLMLS
jgi:oxygen-independent coproporphyrinogen-3 oxidase